MHLVDRQLYGSDASESGFFPGVSPADILKNKKAQQKVQDAITMMQKFNVWLEASVQLTKEGMLKVTDDTRLKVY